VTDALVCEKWLVPLAARGRGGEWFGDWVLTRTSANSRHVTASWAAVQVLARHVPAGGTVREYFGGLGCQALIIRDALNPAEHWVGELHPAGYAHLRKLFRMTGVQVARANAYQVRVEPADLVALDFQDFTVHKAVTERAGWLGLVFGSARRGILLTDSGGSKLHLHRDLYEADLGHPCGSYPEYLAGLDGWLRREFGWRVVAGFYQPWTAVLALAPGAKGPPPAFMPPPARPVGIRLQPDGRDRG
jgi:hypothetical protein